MTSYSLLGKAYDKAFITKNDKNFHAILLDLRKKNNNLFCADCGDSPTQWASVNIGVFLCTECAQIHRGIGTHITKIKSCMGTYNWHPDEIESMQKKGNLKINQVFDDCNSALERPNKHTQNSKKKDFITYKYNILIDKLS